MDKFQLFDIWAPAEGAWTPWARPVLFGSLPRTLPPFEAGPWIEIDWLPLANAALVIDVAGPRAVELGVQFAHLGYRPVPLFNASPPPILEDSSSLPAAVDVDVILGALMDLAPQLEQIRLPPDAPPAFLIDARRATSEISLQYGDYDNRSMVLASDFPSAATLRANGITTVVLVREHKKGLELDLTAVLGQWRRGGLALQAKWLEDGTLHPLRLSRAAALLGVWARVKAAMRYRTETGDYGGILVPAAGG